MASFSESFRKVRSRCPWIQDDMDAALWGTLPRELVVKVLAYVPLHDFLKFRLVCKRWNNLVYDPSFRKSFISKRYGSSFFIAAFNGRCFPGMPGNYGAYNAATGAWNRPFPLFLTEKSEAKLIATAGGLLLWMTGKVEMIGGRALDNRILFMCNPLTKAERQLPPMSTFRNAEELDELYSTMTFNAETNEYTVLIVHVRCIQIDDFKEWDGESPMEAEVFTSKNNRWEGRGTMPEGDCSWYSIIGALHNEELYCIFTSLTDSAKPSLYRIGSCETNNDSFSFWTKIELDLQLTGNYLSAYLYNTGPDLSIAAVTTSGGMTMLDISTLRIAAGGIRCDLQKVYTVALSLSGTDFSHGLCANQTHVFHMLVPFSEEVGEYSRLLVVKNFIRWKGQVGEDEWPMGPFVKRGPALSEFESIVEPCLETCIYEPRFDVDV